MVMDTCKTVRRRSLQAAGYAAPPPRTTQAVEGSTKPYTGAFNRRLGTRDAATEQIREPCSPKAPFSEDVVRSKSSASLTSLSASIARDIGPDQNTRPQSAGATTDSTSKLSRSTSRGAAPAALPTIMEKTYVEILQNRTGESKITRWDARTRTTSVWDGLRRDSELYSQRGNCQVHFCGKGLSRRGPSLKIPLEKVYLSRFQLIFTLFRTEIARNGLNDSLCYDDLERQCDIYIPAPADSSRKDAFTWHITTRNFFAFILGRPLVGASLGEALKDLRERLDLFRPDDSRNQGDLMAYMERIGYLEFSHCPDYALALLNFAEHYHMHDLWVDAFVHCVGMNEALIRSPEFQHVSRVTNALITRAYLEMDLHLGRVTRALTNFLEEDFSPAFFGASSGTRIHLDRFRTFLHSYYVEKFGYWPPPKGSHFSKALYKSMYFDFRSLYDFLVDLDSNDELGDQKPALGGICVLQNVKAFDKRHKFIPLPHPHPLVPHEVLLAKKTSSQRSLRALKLGAKTDPLAELTCVREALAAATNSKDITVASSPIVKAYQRFEREFIRTEEKVSTSDARKARWLLIYGTLQMLVSVIRAPKEVRFTETTYPLCCLVTGTPPWLAGTKSLISQHHPSIQLASPVVVKTAESIIDITVQPDCEVDSFFFSPTPPLPQMPFNTVETSPATPAHSRAGLFREASIRSVKSLSNSIGSFSSRGSRRHSLLSTVPVPPPPQARSTPQFCEIFVPGYGNGLNEAVTSIATPSELSSEVLPEIVILQQSPALTPPLKDPQRPGSSRRCFTAPPQLVLKPFSSPEPSRTPLMENFDVHSTLPGLEEFSDSPSTYSNPLSPTWSSSRSNSPGSSTSSYTTTTTAENTSRRGSALSVQDDFSPISPAYSVDSFISSVRPNTSPTLSLSPLSPVFSRPTSSGTITALSSKKSMDLPMVVDIEEMQCYTPTGIPSTVLDEEEEFPVRSNEKRLSLNSRTSTLKSSLKRSSTLVKSVRIREDPVDFAGKRLSIMSY